MSGNLVRTALVEHAEDLRLATLGLDHRLQTTLLTPRFPTSRHVVALVFAPGDRRPRVVAKIPRRPGDDAGVRTEAHVLRRLETLGGSAVTGVPVVLGTPDVHGRTMLVETAVQGTPLGLAEVARDVPRAVRAGADFVSRMPVVRPPQDNGNWYEGALTAPLEALGRLAGADSEITALVTRTHAVLDPLREVPLPAVFEHGDLGWPNLFLAEDGSTLLVIDWERATEDGLPGHDLTFYLQYVSQCLHGFDPRTTLLTAFDRAFVGPGAWAGPTLRDHLEERGISPRLGGLLVVACWARAAATLVSRLGTDRQDDGSSAAAVREAVVQDRDVVLWRHALRRAEDGDLFTREDAR
ncbi:phosphotransferase family protein [Geodermatophilus sp. SYSU D00742]